MSVMPKSEAKAVSRTPLAAEIFLQTLSDHGVDYCFANPGTDFPAIVEAFVRAKRSNTKVPHPVLVPHENLAVAMAHGVYLMTGRPQAVMVHVNVGTANTINNIANLARMQAPVIVAAGRTPYTEKGQFGSRTRPIHWGQEMFDQAGMVRELVKWDYELHMPDQAADVAARAYEVAMTSPRGPVYLVLPREPLSAPVPDATIAKPRALPKPPYPDPASIDTLAQWIATAERPMIMNAAAGESEAVDILSRIAERYAIPVIAQNPRVVVLPSSHPMHFGFDSAALLSESDLAIVIETDVPYYPHLSQPAADCRFVHIGEDTVFQRYPMRSFPTDMAITAQPTDALRLLEAALEKHAPAIKARSDARRPKLAAQAKARRDKIAKAGQSAADRITPEFLSRTLGEVLGDDAIIFNEYPLRLDHCAREKAGTLFAASPSGGLGWGLGAALGAKLAAPDKMIAATLGDGVYLFTNPTVAHWVSQKHNLPVLTVIFNNTRYGAVRNATLSMFKDGVAGEDDGRFLADLDPSPPYEDICKMHGGFGERVEDPAKLADVIARARDAVMIEKRQALLNVICPY